MESGKLTKKQRDLALKKSQEYLLIALGKHNIDIVGITADLMKSEDDQIRLQTLKLVYPHIFSKSKQEHVVENTTNINVEVKHTNALDQLNQMLEVKPSEDLPQIMDEAEFIEVDEE